MYRTIIPNITDQNMVGSSEKEQHAILDQEFTAKHKNDTDYSKILYIIGIIVLITLIIILIYFIYLHYHKPLEKKENKIKTETKIKTDVITDLKKKEIPNSIMNMDNNILQQYITKKSNTPAIIKESSRMVEQHNLSENVVNRTNDNSLSTITQEEKKLVSLNDLEDYDEEPIPINREEETLIMISAMISENKTNKPTLISNNNILNNPLIVENNDSDSEEEQTCSHVFKSGVNKGKRCNIKSGTNDKCSKH